MTAAEIARHLDAKKTATGWIAHCPAHEDGRESLSIAEGQNGRVLLHCFAGCSLEETCQATGIEMSDLFPDGDKATRWNRNPVAVYRYHDEDGVLKYEKLRYEPKAFSLRRPDGNGGWIDNLRRVKRLLYNLPEVLRSKRVLYVEGERDCQTARRLGLVATTAGSAQDWRREFAPCFAGKRVGVIPDADGPGRTEARRVAVDVLPLAEMVKMVELPGAKDLTEWVERGGNREKLLALIAAAPVLTAADLEAEQKPEPRSADGFKLTRLGDLLAEPEEKTSWLLDGILPAAGVALLAGKPKAGKSTLARCLALAVARGESFLNRATVKGPVLYLALEEKRSEVKKHFEALGATGEEEILIHAEHAPAEAVAAAREAIGRHKPVLVIVDPLLKFARVENANDYAQVTAALEPLLILARESGAHLLLVYHAGKSEKTDAVDAALGSTAFAGAVDTQLVLKRSERCRTLQSVQRYGEDLPETVLDFDVEHRAVALGVEKAEAEVKRVADLMLDFLVGSTEEKTEPEISEAVEGKVLVKRAALRRLVEIGQAIRAGSGKRGDPYMYRFSFSCSQGIQGTREQETKNGAYPSETQAHILVPAHGEQETRLVLTSEVEV